MAEMQEPKSIIPIPNPERGLTEQRALAIANIVKAENAKAAGMKDILKNNVLPYTIGAALADVANLAIRNPQDALIPLSNQIPHYYKS
ncbi:hypothetical protein HY030_01540 [Candidatus Gottesmanbacteria bacterium]|nr:hypothetical protein [Candidatus Gottesmanbacteria bacterium]